MASGESYSVPLTTIFWVISQYNFPTGGLGERQQRSLVLEEPAFARRPAAEPRELAARADHAVAGDDDGDRVPAVGRTDCAGGADVAQATRQLAVAYRRAVRDGAQGAPHAPLKRRAGRVQRKVERRTVPGEVLRQLIAGTGQEATRRPTPVVRLDAREIPSGEPHAGEPRGGGGDHELADRAREPDRGALAHHSSPLSKRRAGAGARRAAPRDRNCGRRGRGPHAARSVRCRAGCG